MALNSLQKNSPLAPHLALGKKGEELAEKFLKNLGYNILGRNVRFKRDEIDIIAKDMVDDVIVFVEVKARARYSEDFLPAANAGYKKWRKLHRAAYQWVAQKKYEGGWRIDLVSVAGGKVIEHTKEIGSWF